MKNLLMRRITLAFALVTLLSSLAFALPTQDQMMGDKMKEDSMMSKTRPTVAVIRADWCSACKKIEPGMAELQATYKGRLNFVILDVSTDESAAVAAATARKLGISKFFEANKKKTSTVAVFDAKKKVLFQTDHNYDQSAYVKAFDNALAKAGMRG